jgi:hypothetical protein
MATSASPRHKARRPNPFADFEEKTVMDPKKANILHEYKVINKFKQYFEIFGVYTNK